MSQSDNDYSKESNTIILLSSHQRARRMQRNGTTDATWQLLKPPLLVPLNNIKEHLYIRSSTLLQLD
eukprot:scaffold2111_cov267-Chaetoceros_neogracile.AAC.17